MAYLDTNSRTVKPTSNETFQGIGRLPALFGVFIGFVKRADDVQKNGRLQVWIPEFGSAPDEEQGWITVNYCSPFAGATNVNTVNRNNFQDFNGTQTSYGMWMVPPDLENQVLVMFINGDSSKGIWIGSLYNQFVNNMVPAMAADTKNHQYPGKAIPVAEYNKWDQKITEPDLAVKPYEKTKFQGVGNQGLINDPVRGITNTSARRESPSAVFGILTPGPVIDKSAPAPNIRRKGGSSFIMDDGDCSEYVELATKSGSKIRLDETNGIVYIINRDGTAWVQLDAEGNVDIFSAKNISLRGQRDVNIRADRNINIEAGQNIFMKAAKDTTETVTSFTYDVNNHPDKRSIQYWKYVGEGNGSGGNIVMQSLNNWHNTVKNNAFFTVTDNNLDIQVGTSLLATTKNGGQNFSSKMGVKITTDAALDIAATGNIRLGTTGSLNVTSDGNLILCSNGELSLSSTGNANLVSAGKIGVDGLELNISTNVVAENLNVNQFIAASVDTQVINSRTVVFDKRPIGSGNPLPTTAPDGAETIIPEAPLSADPARPAEIKPVNDKINILATWEDPQSKFKRDRENIKTTASRLPTYEPCPEHDNIAPSIPPVLTQTDITYEGSAGAGNTVTSQPPASTDPGSGNKTIQADSSADSSSSKEFNNAAFVCQIKYHEGVRYESYQDGPVISAGVGHLLRANELALYPLGTPVPKEQVEKWLEEDIKISIKIAKTLCKDSWNDLSDIRKRAVVDLAYNLGQPRLSKFTKFLEAMNSKNFDKAVIELKNSKWYTQVGRRGPNITTMISQSIDPLGCDKKFPG